MRQGGHPQAELTKSWRTDCHLLISFEVALSNLPAFFRLALAAGAGTGG